MQALLVENNWAGSSFDRLVLEALSLEVTFKVDLNSENETILS